MRKLWRALLFCILLVATMQVSKTAFAATKNITLNDSSSSSICMNVGDSGQFLVDTTKTLDSEWHFSGDLESDTQIATFTYSTSAPSDTLAVASNGTYQALKTGKVSIMVSGYNKDGKCVYYNVFYNIYIAPDMTNVHLKKTSYTVYLCNKYNTSVTIQDALLGITDWNDEIAQKTFQYQSSNSKMSINCVLENRAITIKTSQPGTTQLIITLANKVFTIHLTVSQMAFKESDSLLLVKGNKKTMHVQGVSKGITWKSSNSKVVSVTSKGVLKAKKNGNAIITAKVSGGKIGCVVSVVSKKRKQVITQAVRIGKTCTYSQKKRMQKGFYDCSSLVWRSYRLEKKYFGMKYYAPVAADTAKWCASHKKIVKGNKTTNLQKMKYKPGALMFETGASNGRYKGIYHVEMFIGYCFNGFDQNGKAMVGPKWANRPDNYYGTGDLWANL